MITPMDLENKKFSTSMRGYSKNEVDAFMAELVKEYETLYRENRGVHGKSGLGLRTCRIQYE